MNPTERGGGLPDAFRRFRFVCCDFEFGAAADGRVRPECMVAIEFDSGREWQLGRSDLLKLRRAPFDTGPDTIFVAFQAAAEMGCFLELGWPLPARVLDLYIEHRNVTNGLGAGTSLIAVLARHGLAHIDASEKKEWRQLAMDPRPKTEVEMRGLLAYCRTDVEALLKLLPTMAPSISLPPALHRGRYSGPAVARIEREGLPLDVPLYQSFAEHWPTIKLEMIREVDASLGIYDGTRFRMAEFRRVLGSWGVLTEWPLTPCGRLATDNDTLKEKVERYRYEGRPFAADLERLRQLGKTLDRVHALELDIGSDGRARAELKAFWTITGRNGPEARKFLWLQPKWMRSFIRPAPGYGVVYLDWASQEIAIAAALSGDRQLAAAYAAGDPYTWFARTTGLMPADVDEKTRAAARKLCKTLFLATNYGAGPGRVAANAGIEVNSAKRLLRLHRETFPALWHWSEQTVDRALLGGRLQSPFGWQVRGREHAGPPDLMNWPMQAAGGDMMRIAAIAAAEAGIAVHAVVHDAFLIGGPADRLERDGAMMHEIMIAAGRAVTGGLEVRVDVSPATVWPDRYADKDGAEMWGLVSGLLARRGGWRRLDGGVRTGADRGTHWRGLGYAPARHSGGLSL
jgi:DNA polymerase-1